MGKYNDKKWIGKKFGMLTVLRPVHVSKVISPSLLIL